MNSDEFLRQKQAAVERMREMNLRSENALSKRGGIPPTPPFVKATEGKTGNEVAYKEPLQGRQPSLAASDKPKRENNPPAGTPFGGIPFLEGLLKEPDSVLIIGLLLILMSEKSDKMLLFALIYILL